MLDAGSGLVCDMSSLGPDDIHIWSFHLDRLTPDLAVLSREELDRANRMLRPGDRTHFLNAHSAVRHILSKYTKASPNSLQFDISVMGKPSLNPKRLGLVPAFNLSHSEGIGVLAVSARAQIGVDIEVDRHMEDLQDLAARIMTPAETRDFLQMGEAEQRAAFYSLWTRKESLLKAIGCGLSKTPAEVELGLTPRTSLSIAAEETIWTVSLFSVAANTYAAATVEGESGVLSHFVYRPG
jgi:4'-phosphopantetheinyl transferase